jgi:hypothetical protein
MGVFGVIVGILAAIPAPGLQAGAAAIQTALALGEALTPTLTGEEPNQLDETFAQMRRHVAELQQQTRDAITAQRRQVLGDYGLLATVGRLIASNSWQLDRQAALSSGRQGFTRSVYEAFIPVLWDRWEVTGCIVNRSFAKQMDCSVPSAGPLVKTTGLDFQGVFARQKPCDFNPSGGKLTCRWKSFEELGYGDTVKTLLDPVTSACTYNAIAGTSWRYGCSLGISATELMREPPPPASPWTFQVLRCKGKRPEARETRTCPEVQPGRPAPLMGNPVGNQAAACCSVMCWPRASC